MSHLKSKLARLSAMAAVLGAAACSHNTPTASAPTAVRPAETYSAYGPALGEGAGYAQGPSTEPTPGSVGKAPPLPPTSAQMGFSPTVSAVNNPAPAPAPVTWGSGPADTHQEAMGVTNPMGGMADVSTLSDAQLAAVVQAINQGEIDESNLALSKSGSPDVKRFARDMVGAHRDMQNKTNALLSRLQITPSENAVSNQLKSDTQSEMQELQSMRGKDFDRDYIDSQVRNHNKALEILERVTPNVKNPELKTALMNDRPKVEAHLRQAERVQQTLQRGNANPQPASP
jgi:putative membrane protein